MHVLLFSASYNRNNCMIGGEGGGRLRSVGWMGGCCATGMRGSAPFPARRPTPASTSRDDAPAGGRRGAAATPKTRPVPRRVTATVAGSPHTATRPAPPQRWKQQRPAPALARTARQRPAATTTRPTGRRRARPTAPTSRSRGPAGRPPRPQQATRRRARRGAASPSCARPACRGRSPRTRPTRSR